MFERNVISKLEQWVANKNHKPLILRGSRQVGKTTLVDSFSQNFENYLYLNFEKNPSAIILFRTLSPNNRYTCAHHKRLETFTKIVVA